MCLLKFITGKKQASNPGGSTRLNFSDLSFRVTGSTFSNSYSDQIGLISSISGEDTVFASLVDNFVQRKLYQRLFETTWVLSCMEFGANVAHSPHIQ